MNDLISRQALCEYALNQKDKSITPNDIMRFPSAQPKKRTEERTETHGVCLDAIDRQVAIDADHLKRWIISRGLKSQLHPADIIDQIDRESTIEPRCETCESFNKTRLLIPQPERKKGKWIPVTKIYKVTEGQFPNTHIEWVDATEPDEIDAVRCSECREVFDFQDARNWCTECGADMREDAEEPKKCDTCKHVKSQWFNRCADCSDFELWESKDK